MSDRREFLKKTGIAAGAIAASGALRNGRSSRERAGRAGSAARPRRRRWTPRRRSSSWRRSTPRSWPARATPTRASAATAQNFVFTREQQIVNVVDTDSIGCGVRALVDGTWGFAATQHADEGRRRGGGAEAVGDREGEPHRARPRRSARAGAVVSRTRRGRAPYTIDPFTIPIEQKADLLLKANAEAMKVDEREVRQFSGLFFVKEERNYANTDGSVITQTVIRSWVAVADHGGRAGLLRLPESRQRRRRRSGAAGSTSSSRISSATRGKWGEEAAREAQGEAGRGRPLRSRAASVAPLAHDPRVDRASDGARSRDGLRGELRRHELRRAARESARQAQVRPGVHEHSGRPLAGGRAARRSATTTKA